MSIKEEAPANATGTPVAGTGDDSSTVVVKKKKKLQDKLMRRLKIKEAIDKAIPDLQYPKDKITEIKNQLKELAKNSEPRDDDITGKKVFKPAKHMPKDSAGKLDVTEPIKPSSGLSKAKKVDSKKDGGETTTPDTNYKGLAFSHSVPNYTKA
mgnify:CR=1 FL=1